MHQRKSKKIFIYFFLLIIVSSISNNSLNNFKLSQIQTIKISGLEQKENDILLSKIKNFTKENIFLINQNKIEQLINSNPSIEKFEVFKKYPSTIDINIVKTNFFAKINYNGKFFLIGSNGKLIPNKNLNNEIPFIFGNPNIIEFLKFKKIIDKSKFSYNQIDNIYFFPSNRWDIKLKENILLKLPHNFNHKNLNHLYEFIEINSGKNLEVVDYRIANQIILNE